MTRTMLCLLPALLLAACGGEESAPPEPTEPEERAPSDERPAPAESEESAAGTAATCPDGELDLPEGLCAEVFAEALGPARHIAVRDDGTIYANLSNLVDGHGLVAARDTDGDGRVDETEHFGDFTGTGMLIHNGWLYATSDTDVYRWALPEDGLAPEGDPELVVGGFPEQGNHAAKSIAIGEERLFVNVGAPSNACMEQSRTKGSPGMDPCPLLETQGGIWAFDVNATGQEYAPEARFASGIRNAVALAWDANAGGLYAVQHGRDQLSQFFPELYDDEANAELPAEEMFAVDEGDELGWPYCYYNHRTGAKVLNPEYGGDGEKVGRCADFEEPVAAFPGHWAPNGMIFYTGQALPERYRGGTFIAFHGSWNRAPLPQAGYNVAFVPFADGEVSGDWEVFADGFAGTEELASPGEAEHRPMGLAQGPDGALFIASSTDGRVWRVTRQGDE